ncbi:MAG: hypothetical protein U0X87_04400 [Anaerolineales bacterium]
MKNSKRFPPSVAIIIVFGIIGLLRFSEGVRLVNAVGLSGSGFALGVGFLLLVLGFTGKLNP